MSEHTTTLAQARVAPVGSQKREVVMGFASLESFELMQRAAKLLSSSTLVPAQYRSTIEKLDKFGNVKESRENPNALANSVVALNMSQRMNADPLMVMQNLHIIEGRPSWSSQWIIAAINGCGRFSPLRFDIKTIGKKTVEYKSSFWDNGQRQTKVEKVQIDDQVCIAWAIEKETGERIESPSISIELAVKEGWYTKNGSKWQTMPDVMLRYRTASFFGKLYAPELLMGLTTVEEAQDMVLDASTALDGSIYVNTDDLRQEEAARTERRSAKKEAKATEAEDVIDNAESDQPETEPEETINQETGEVLKTSQQRQQKPQDDEDNPYASLSGNQPARQTRARRSVDAD